MFNAVRRWWIRVIPQANRPDQVRPLSEEGDNKVPDSKVKELEELGQTLTRLARDEDFVKTASKDFLRRPARGQISDLPQNTQDRLKLLEEEYRHYAAKTKAE